MSTTRPGPTGTGVRRYEAQRIRCEAHGGKGCRAHAERAALINRVLTTVYQASAVALHEVYGFGPERISRFRDGMESVIQEYGVLLDDTDADYADGKLAQRYEAIMGDEAYPAE